MAWKVWTSAIYGLMTKCTALFEPAVRSVLESENWTIWERKKEEDIQIFIGLLGRGRYISKWLPYFLRITNRLDANELGISAKYKQTWSILKQKSTQLREQVKVWHNQESNLGLQNPFPMPQPLGHWADHTLHTYTMRPCAGQVRGGNFIFIYV